MEECKETSLQKEIDAIERLLDIIHSRVHTENDILSHLSEKQKHDAIMRYHNVYYEISKLLNSKLNEWNDFIEKERTIK